MVLRGEKMRYCKKAISLMFFLCISLLSAAIALRMAFTLQPDTTLFIDPPTILRQNLTIGERFSVNVAVTNVTDLRGYEFTMSFNTAMLDIVGITLLPEANLPVGSWLVDDPSGILWINVTYDGATISTNAPVALANIQFKAMNAGQSPLHLYDTGLFDSLGNGIAHQTQDGIVTILRHDVAIASVIVSTAETYTGRNVTVTVIAENNGDALESFTVEVYHNATVFAAFDVIDLASGTNITILFSWNTSDVVAGNIYAIKAEATAVPYEVDLGNNVAVDGTVKVKIIGDVNGDNKVNLDDWIAYDAAWGTHEGDLNWNPQADIDGDGFVDNDDGVLIAENYRNTA